MKNLRIEVLKMKVSKTEVPKNKVFKNEVFKIETLHKIESFTLKIIYIQSLQRVDFKKKIRLQYSQILE